MERRLRKVELIQGATRFQQLAALVAEDFGLDPAEVLAEAERVRAEYAGLSLVQIAAREGHELTDLEAQVRDLEARLAQRTRS